MLRTLLAVAVALGAAQFVAVSSSRAEAAQPGFTCVARAATLKVPRVNLLALRGYRGESQILPKARRLSPVCKAGQVPLAVAKFRGNNPRFGKGNPLIGNYSGGGAGFAAMRGEALGAFVRRNLIMPFDQVYWKRNNRSSARAPKAPDPPGCNGVMTSGSCYYYGSAAISLTADGAGMTEQIERPAYVNTGGGAGHTLNEISVQGGPSDGNIVELGWSVSTDQFGDADPHMFIFHWINWAPTCYNTCGWNQVSATYFPGMNLSALVGQNVYIGYVHNNGAWWAWFNDQWLGYFLDAEWGGAYTQNDISQHFGEVSSANGIPPQTAMGDGQFPASAAAANMATLCSVDATAWVCWYRDNQALGATHPAYYDILRTGYGAVRYGGPGS
jgi:neprosin-like protein